MHLHTLDWVIALIAVAICFIPALFFGKRSGKNTAEFFASGRSVPWWLAGLSMVATTFSSDTPNLVANFVRTQGVAGNWQWWAFTLTGVATVFFYARLWRRSGVLTDLEFYEMRYSGKAAGAVRGFRAVYLGLLFNCMIMATVNLAACKIAAVLFGFERWQTLLAVGLLNVVFAAHSGLWGVLVIDMFQFFIKMSAVIAAAYFAVTLPQVGGLQRTGGRSSRTMHGPGGVNYLNMLPDFTNNWDLAVAVFIMPHRGAVVGRVVSGRGAGRRQLHRAAHAGLEIGKGRAGQHAVLQRRALRAAALAVDSGGPGVADRLSAALRHPDSIPAPRPQPDRPRHRVPRHAAVPAGGLDGADAGRPDRGQFVHHPDAPELGRVVPGARLLPAVPRTRARPSTITCWPDAMPRFCCSWPLPRWSSRSIRRRTAFNLILQVGAGTGLLYLVRWFWWRVTAWCEIVAMISLVSGLGGLPVHDQARHGARQRAAVDDHGSPSPRSAG